MAKKPLPSGNGESLKLTLTDLQRMVQEASLIRLAPESQILEPAGGPGSPVAPALYKEAKLAAAPKELQAFSQATGNAYCVGRDPEGQATTCVLLNSVAAEANLMEAALAEARHELGNLIPDIEVDFTEDERTRHLGLIGALTAPHRGFDALLRDSFLGNDRFMNSEIGRQIAKSRLQYATPLLRIPHMLIFGAWHSQGAGGGRGAKFARSIRSEIYGYGAIPAYATASRIDPASIEKSVTIYKTPDEVSVKGTRANDLLAQEGKSRPNIGWDTDEKYAEHQKGKAILYPVKGSGSPGAPSLLNHGNVLPTARSARATIEGAVHDMSLSLPSLRKLQFPREEGGKAKPEDNIAARTALAALALVAMTERIRAGYSLRSGCDLIPRVTMRLQLIGASLEDVTTLNIDIEGAHALLKAAVADLKKTGLQWGSPAELTLRPAPQLTDAIVRSRNAEPDADEEE